jgi:glycosyltransferase involved in cell wall biosynthesis
MAMLHRAAHRPLPPRRRWTINGRFLTQPVTGVQRYGREILLALDRLIAAGHPLAEGIEAELLAPRNADVPPLAAIKIRRVGRRGGQAWEQAVLPLYARGALLSLCNTSTAILRRQIVCIHDTTVWDYPESYARPFRLLYRILLPLLGRRAAAITTVSQSSARQLVRRGIVRGTEPLVVPNGHEHVRRWRRDIYSLAATGEDVAVVIGSLAPHKNLPLVMRLAERIEGSGIRIAVAGAIDPAVFNHPAILGGDRVTWLGRLSDDALANLLGSALCLLFPSFSEGFGLPALEAMALGCPVIASNAASIPEICGEAALYAPPTDPQAWHAALLRLRGSATLRRRLIEAGRARALQFSWRRSAESYLGLMAWLDAVPASVTPPAVRAAE